MRDAAELAARGLSFAGGLVKVGVLTTDMDDAIRDWFFAHGKRVLAKAVRSSGCVLLGDGCAGVANTCPCATKLCCQCCAP
jgi:hypothetical protein